MKDKGKQIVRVSTFTLALTVSLGVYSTQANAPSIPQSTNTVKEFKELAEEKRIIREIIAKDVTNQKAPVVAASEIQEKPVKKVEKTPPLADVIAKKTGWSLAVSKHFLQEQQKFDVPLDIALGLYKLESRFDANAVNKKSGATGLGQIMPKTGEGLARQLGLPYSREKLKDPFYNITLSMYYLRQLHDKYGNWSTALVAYNEGPGNANKKIASRGTKRLQTSYSRTVQSNALEYNFTDIVKVDNVK